MKPMSDIAESTPNVLNGAWVFKNTRAPVANLFATFMKGKSLRHYKTQYQLVDIEDAAFVVRHARRATVGFEDSISPALKKFPTDELFTFLAMDANISDFLVHFPLVPKDHVNLVLEWACKTVVPELRANSRK